MARQPINQVNALQTRAALWTEIRVLRMFTAAQLRKETRCSISQVREYLLGLTASGILQALPPNPAEPDGERATLYNLVSDVGPLAPRVRRDGSAVTQGIGRLQLWKAMRVLGRFTVRDLVVGAATEEHAVAEGEAKNYCHYLHLAGYLTRRADVYQLVRSRYSGPRPPMIQRVKNVYDPNLGKVVWTQGGEK